METRRLAVNPVPCTGCMNCVTVCAQGRAGDHVPGAAALRVELDLFGGVHRHGTCRQCEKPSCAAACPAGAIVLDPGTGAWVLREALCTGCLQCVPACPFGALFVRDDTNLPVKCHLCGGDPRCVAACRFGVLRYLFPSDPGFAFRGMPPEEQDPLLGRGGP